MPTTINDVVNQDGSVTRTITTTVTINFTAQTYQDMAAQLNTENTTVQSVASQSQQAQPVPPIQPEPPAPAQT